MILTIDIGNTNIVLGGFLDEKLQFVARVATHATLTEDEYAAKLLSILNIHGVSKDEIKGAIISSVVPPLNSIMKKAVQFVCGKTPMLVGPGVKTGINIHCDDPSSVGADLICCCVAANTLYGSPCIIVDMGTATKILYVNEKSTFEGASIIPGVLMGLKALSSGTAQLPQVGLEAPESVIGKNTVDCMRGGVVFGNAAMLDGMLNRYIEEIGTEIPVIATGGMAQVIVPHCKHKITMAEDLLLKGLYLIYQKNS